jgi:subtilisin
MMKHFLTAACAALVAAPSLLGQSASQGDRYIVTITAGNQPAAVAAAHGLNARHVYTHVLNGFAAHVPPGRLAALANDPRVAGIDEDRLIFAFGKPPKPPPPTPSQTVPAGVARVRGSATQTGAGVGVAIVDTGLDFNHLDLPVSTAWSFVSPGFAYTTSAQDDYGHGTHVGGIVAAKNNNLDVVGVAPGATLYAVKVLDNTGSGYDSDVISGLEAVVNPVDPLGNAVTLTPAIKVINMSLGRDAGTPDEDLPLHTAIQSVVDAGITVVVAAGNNPYAEVSDMVPAGFSEVIAVGSTTAQAGSGNARAIAGDTASFFTTDGLGVTISAPGEEQENVQGRTITSVGVLSTALGGGTTRMSGTSMAAPHVAGVVALLLEKAPGLDPSTIKARIMLGDRVGIAPLNSPTTAYSFDGEREGIVYAPSALTGP